MSCAQVAQTNVQPKYTRHEQTRRRVVALPVTNHPAAVAPTAALAVRSGGTRARRRQPATRREAATPRR